MSDALVGSQLNDLKKVFRQTPQVQLNASKLVPLVGIVKAQLKQAYDICRYARDRVTSGYQFEDEFSRMLLTQKQTNYALPNDLTHR